jgi:hypothetical protein
MVGAPSHPSLGFAFSHALTEPDTRETFDLGL